jgi:type II secretory pathway pseudopilin PulG
MSLVETLVALAVSAIGMTGVAALVMASSTVVKRNYAITQAQAVAQRELERIVALGCNDNCANIKLLDGNARSLYWNATGELTDTPPAVGPTNPVKAEFRVSVDVDPPYEGAERGIPRLDRPMDTTNAVVGTLTGGMVNVRVSVSWQDTAGKTAARPRQVAVLQTRMAPP